jgi:hypothetical protein
LHKKLLNDALLSLSLSLFLHSTLIDHWASADLLCSEVMIKSMKPPNSSSGIHHPIARILQLVVLNSLYRKSSEHPPPGGVPSALFVPLANYLPPTFRLPAMAMSQQKAFAAPAQLPILIPHRQPLAFPILQKVCKHLSFSKILLSKLFICTLGRRCRGIYATKTTTTSRQ